MQPKFVKKDAFKVIGIEDNFTMENNIIPQMWDKFLPRMIEIKNPVHQGVALGICFTPETVKCTEDINDKTVFTELVCIEVNNTDNIPDGMIAKSFPANEYAVFTHKGSLAKLKDTYNFIYKEWVPKSGCELTEYYEFELYDRRFNPMDQENSEIDIYLPVKRG